MDVASLHYQFKLNKDRIDTLSNIDFRKSEIDWLLNEAQLIVVKTRFNGHNPKQVGFENTQKRVDDLAPLVIKYPLQPALVPTDSSGVYEVDLSSLAYTYLHYVSGYVDLVLAEDCTKQVNLKFIQHDDYRNAIRDPFNNASSEFVPFNFGRASSGTGTSIYIYPDDYSITNVYIEYLKYPSRISYGNYVFIDGNTYPAATSELPEHLHPEIVDVACQIAALNIESPEYVQLKSQKVFLSE